MLLKDCDCSHMYMSIKKCCTGHWRFTFQGRWLNVHYWKNGLSKLICHTKAPYENVIFYDNKLLVSCTQIQHVTSIPYKANISLSFLILFKKVKKYKKMYCLHIYSHFSKCPASCWFKGWGSLTTAMAAIPPTQERMAWHLPELQGGNTFFWNGRDGIYKAERTHAGTHWDSFTLAC